MESDEATSDDMLFDLEAVKIAVTQFTGLFSKALL
jgi:hypothetical protein